jgi:multidrug efflux pump
MSLSSISIKRPVLATVLSLVIIIFGFIGFYFLGVREYPNIDPPIITVVTSYVGASSSVIESQITEPLEESISGISGIKSVSSVSRDERSTITVEFDLSVDLETAANDVRDKVSGAIRKLPTDADPPSVVKSDADASPIIFLTIQSKERGMLEMTDIANNVFKERFKTIPGVSDVQVWGEKKYAMRLWLDPDKMASLHINPGDIVDALQRENVELPSGSIEGSNVEMPIRTMGRLQTEEDFNNLILSNNNGTIIRLRDVGLAALGPENIRSALERDGVPMVGNSIVPQSGSNYIEIADRFYKVLNDIKKDLPKDINVAIGFDNTLYIKDSIKEVEQTIYIAFALVVFIIFLFLRDWRTTIIPVLAIPVSLIGSFFIMYVMGFSINLLTLLGIVLAIGLVVDDAIVVLENIYSKLEEGMEPHAAAREGANEVYFAVISTTITLAAVFMPVIFLQGLVGRLFREFGFVVAGSVIISAFVSLSLTPMLASILLKRRQKHSRFYTATEPYFVKLNNGYFKALSNFMGKRWITFAIMFASVAMIFGLGKFLPSELAPIEDRSGLRIMATAPEGSTYDFMRTYMDKLFNKVKQEVPESESMVTITSPGFGASSSTNTGFIRMTLVDPDHRERTQQQIADQLAPELSGLNDARTFIIQEQTIGSSRSGLPVQYVLQAPTFDDLKKVLPQFLDAARKEPAFTYVDADLKFNKPEIRLEIDRNKANSLGVSTVDVARALQLAFSGQRFGYFILKGKQYQVIGQASRNNRSQPGDISSIYVRNNAGKMIQLDNLVKLSEQSTPPQLYRYNRFVSATVSAALAKGKTIGDGLEVMDNVAAKVLPASFSTALAGASKDYKESSSSIFFAFFLALVLIYLVLAAQFESFIDPFIILFTVPLALAGAILSLWYFNQTLNIFSEIGIIMLIGLVTKNGILIVEFANQRKEAGLRKWDAIMEAARARFRPIIMTSLCTILGILPIALALGNGAQSRVSMGIAVVGGMIFSTGLTLFVIPVIYGLMSREHKKHNFEEEEKQTQELEEAAAY